VNSAAMITNRNCIRDYIKLAEKTIDYYHFSYVPRGIAALKCARHVQKVHKKHPDANDHMLYIVAKTFLIGFNHDYYNAIHKKEERPQYDHIIQDIVDTLSRHGSTSVDVGHVNYVISNIIWKLFDANKKYKTANDLLGVLDAVKQEFYRRKVSIYEDEKIIENGDI